MIRATLDTRHFSFEAYGDTEAGALHVLRRAWNGTHRMQYRDAKNFDDFVNDGDVSFLEVHSGRAYRDNEEIA